MLIWMGIAIASLFSLMTTMLEHYLPWSLLLLKPLSRPVAYFLGVMAIAVPLSLLFILFPDLSGSDALIAFWCITASAGIGTIIGYSIDSILDYRLRTMEAEKREKQLVDGMN
jgi:membrane protein YqaA with SNARE-associated domain